MKIFVAGATGRVAGEMIKELVHFGHYVTAGARRPDKVIRLEGVTPVHMDLHESTADLSKVIAENDAVYFTAGSRGKDLLQTDAFGAVKLMQAAHTVEITRFVMLSSVFATEPDKWTDPNLINLTNYNIAKYFADQWLIQNTDLTYTIIQPGNLVEAPEGSGKIAINVEKSQPNSIPNVARTLAYIADKDNTFKKIIRMSDGETPIAQAIDSI